MRHLFLPITMLAIVNINVAQSIFKNADSLLHARDNSLIDIGYVRTLLKTGDDYRYNDASRATSLYLKALELSQKLKYDSCYAESLIGYGEAQGLNGNFTESITILLKGLHEAEKLKDDKMIGLAYAKLASVNSSLGDHRESIKYIEKFMQRRYLQHWSMRVKYAYGLLANSYSKLNVLDSALFYSQRSYELDVMDDDHWAHPYAILGEVHAKLGHNALALGYYNSVFSLNSFTVDLIDANTGIAKVFRQMGHNDSALFYAKRALRYANKDFFQIEVLAVYSLLKDIYKADRKLDSALFYYELIEASKDSMFASEKLNEIKNIKFSEQLREIEIARANYEALETRRRNLQYVAIAIGLLSLVIVFITLSTSVVVREKFVRFVGVVTLLLLFEFITLFTHPFISSFTAHSPIWTLLIMVCVATLLVPAHHRIERWVTHQLVEKNKRIRLAAAKKTIQRLEGH
jgi:tetratricopeptide (TPR) repeat protein